MADDKKKPEDETPKAQAEGAVSSEDLSDDELSSAAGGGDSGGKDTDNTSLAGFSGQWTTNNLSG